jgi:hypothetical protein
MVYQISIHNSFRQAMPACFKAAAACFKAATGCFKGSCIGSGVRLFAYRRQPEQAWPVFARQLCFKAGTACFNSSCIGIGVRLFA